MAAASSLAIAFPGPVTAKAEPFHGNRSSTSPAAAATARTSLLKFRVGRAAGRSAFSGGRRRGAVRGSPRCEAHVDLEGKAAANMSALEQFKISTDRKFISSISAVL